LVAGQTVLEEPPTSEDYLKPNHIVRLDTVFDNRVWIRVEKPFDASSVEEAASSVESDRSGA
jgi:hypothetical protein